MVANVNRCSLERMHAATGVNFRRSSLRPRKVAELLRAHGVRLRFGPVAFIFVGALLSPL